MCERVSPQDFHGASAQQYTEKCVEDLVNSKSFKAYVRHVEYSERLYLTWFVVSIGLTAVLGYHLYFFDTTHFINPLDKTSLKLMEDQAALVPSLLYVALFLTLYLFPCAVIALFIGFFEVPTVFDSVISYGVLTLLNCALVLFGGPWCHHPPFLVTEPALPWLLPHTHGEVWTEMFRVVFLRVAPLQGFLTAGFLVARWRRTFWARLWHIPFPLISVPLLVGVSGAFYWQFTELLKPYLLNAEGQPTHVSVYLWGSAISDPHGVISLWIAMLKEVIQTMTRDVQGYILSGTLPPSLKEANLYLQLYLASLLMTLVYFITMLAKPVFTRFLNGILYFFPTHPTTWGLALLSSFASLAFLMHMDEIPIVYVVVVVYIIGGLFYNGFVA